MLLLLSQLQDLLKFGIDKLLENQESSMEQFDLEKVVGRSEDGKWLVEEEETESRVRRCLAIVYTYIFSLIQYW